MADTRLIDVLSPDIRIVNRLKWPGTEREVGILDLRCSELEDCEVDAREHLVRRGLNIDAPTSAALLERELQVQIAWRILVEPDSKGQPQYRLFKTADETRTRLDPDTRGYFVAWAAHEKAVTAAGWIMPPGGSEETEGPKE